MTCNSLQIITYGIFECDDTFFNWRNSLSAGKRWDIAETLQIRFSGFEIHVKVYNFINLLCPKPKSVPFPTGISGHTSQGHTASPRFAMLCCALPRFAALCRALPRFAALCRALPRFAALCRALPRFAALCCVLLCLPAVHRYPHGGT